LKYSNEGVLIKGENKIFEGVFQKGEFLCGAKFVQTGEKCIVYNFGCYVNWKLSGQGESRFSDT
jgi:hypothetical protein